MCLYLLTKFQVSSIVHSNKLRQWVILPHPPKNEPVKSLFRLGLKPILLFSFYHSLKNFKNSSTINNPKDVTNSEFFTQRLYGQGESGWKQPFLTWSGKVRECQGMSGKFFLESGKFVKWLGIFFFVAEITFIIIEFW